MLTQNAKQPETPPGLVALRLARQLRKEGQGDEAAWLYRSLDGQPEEAAARLELAQLMQGEGRYGAAVQLYDGLERSGCLALRGQLGRLRALRLQHRYADAEAGARHLLAGLPDEPDLLLEAGRLALFGENFPLALARLELATVMSPERPEALEALIEAQLALGRFPAVAAQLQDLVTSEPLAVRWRELQAQAAEAQGDLEGAIAHWRRVLEIEGHSLPARLAVGRILIETGRWAETVRIYQDLAQTHPGAAEPLVQLAKLAIRQAQPGEALGWLERARALRPEDARLNRDIARAYAEDGQASAARRFVRQLCEARPESPDGSITAAAIEELLGAVPRAVTILRRTLRDHPQSFPTAVNLARLLERQGSFRPALQAIESMRELLPECYGAALVRIDLLLELGKTARASEALDTLMLDHGGRGDLQRRLARLEVARGQVGLARRRWARTARLDRHVTGPAVNLYRLDRHPIPPALGEIRLFTRLRSQAHRLPAFLAFYRAQGIDRFFIVDNGSDDGTRDYLLAQPDVHLYLTTDAYAEYGGGMRWLNELLVEHGSGS